MTETHTFSQRADWIPRKIKTDALLICLLLMPLQLFAAVAFDGEPVRTNQSASFVVSLTISGKTTAGSNRYGIVALMAGADTVTGVTWGSNAMTLLGKNQNATDGRTAYLYGISNPPTAASDVVVSIGGGGVRITAVVSSFNGVDPSAPYGTAQTASGTTSPATVNVTDAVTGDMVVDSLYFFGGGGGGGGPPPSVGADQTELGHTDEGARFGSSSYEAGAATVTMSWTLTAPSRWSTVAVALKAASANYVATHCVETYDQVAGGSNDYADLGGTSWANAAAVDGVCSTYTTLGTALANADDDDAVLIEPGSYEGPVGYDSQWDGTFMPANSGSAGHPIVFFARDPNAGPNGWTNCSKLGRPTPEIYPADDFGPVFSTNEQSYITVDGLCADESESRAGASTGVFQIRGGTGSEFRRISVDRRDVTDYTVWCLPSCTPDYNGNAIFVHSATDARIVDAYILGNDTLTDTQNDAAIETYNTDGMTLEYNTFLGAGFYAIFIKGSGVDPIVQTGSIVRQNWIDGYAGINILNTRTAEVSHNVVRADRHAFTWFSTTPTFSALDTQLEEHNNTYICDMSAGAASACTYQRAFLSIAPGSEVKHNIVVGYNAGSGYLMYIEGAWSLDDFSDIDRYNCNVYHDRHGSPRWGDSTGNRANLGDWQSSMASQFDADAYGREIEQDSQYDTVAFEDFDNGDYRLDPSDSTQAALNMTACGGPGPIGAYANGVTQIGRREIPVYN